MDRALKARHVPVAGAITLGLLSAVLTEGCLAAWHAHALGGSGWVLVWAAGLSVAFVFIPTVLAALLAGGVALGGGWNLGRIGRALGSGAGHEGLGILAAAGALGSALWFGQKVGVRAAASMSDVFAAATTSLATLLALVVAVLLLGVLVDALRRHLPTGGDVLLSQITGAPAALALLGVGLLTLLPLPSIWRAAPGAGLLGAALGATRLGHSVRPTGRAMLLITGALITPLMVMSIPKAPPKAMRAMMLGSPYAATVLDLISKWSDQDGDGYASPPLGRDCDDANGHINPASPDLPGNGFDENCSDGDALDYEPPPAPPARPQGQPSNVVLLMLDTVRPDHTGMFGYERDTTPNLDRFAEGATVFSQARTTSVGSVMSLSSIFTGYYAQYLDAGVSRRITDYREGNEMLAEVLAARGFTTGGYSIPHFFHVTRHLEQGFDEWSSPWPVDEWRDYFGKSDEETTDAALGFLEQQDDAPFFLFAHYRCAHGPYFRHDAHDFGDAAIDQYDSSIAHCDEHVGRVIQAIDRDHAEDTTVVVFSDHGEELGERGLEFHGSSLYESAIRVLLLVRAPAVEMPAEVNAPVLLTDIHPTIRQLAGAETPEGLHGWSLLAIADDPSIVRDRPLFTFTGHIKKTTPVMLQGLVLDGYKLVRDSKTGDVELYDLNADPAEETNLAVDDPERRVRMLEVLDGLLARITRL